MITGTIKLLKNNKPIREIRFNHRGGRKSLINEYNEIIKNSASKKDKYEISIFLDEIIEDFD